MHIYITSIIYIDVIQVLSNDPRNIENDGRRGSDNGREEIQNIKKRKNRNYSSITFLPHYLCLSIFSFPLLLSRTTTYSTTP